MPPPQSTSTSPMTRSAPLRSPTHRSCQQDSESAEEATPTSQTVRESQAPTLTPEPRPCDITKSRALLRAVVTRRRKCLPLIWFGDRRGSWDRTLPLAPAHRLTLDQPARVRLSPQREDSDRRLRWRKPRSWNPGPARRTVCPPQ